MYSEVRKKADSLADCFSASIFAGRRVGLEKECLRVSASGAISQLDHPKALGKALTHPFVTTDFSEALLEMVTPPCESADQALDFLSAIHQFIVDRLPEDEHIWNTSMPCILRGGQSVRIGEYGNSFSGQMKHAYRRGLGLRYGRRMQAIAGVHFNFSMPDSVWLYHKASDSRAVDASSCKDQWTTLDAGQQQGIRTQGYFQMMQNLLRVGWMVPYLFGASPAICTSFLNEGEGDELDVWNGTTRYAPFGTSLRMGKIGYRYREDQPIDLSVRHTSVEHYIDDIIGHVKSSHPAYEALGELDEHGLHQQLSTSRLQIENEYYSSVRPKQIAAAGELPISALRDRGIRYLELRSVDVNLLEPNGLERYQLAMLEMLMLFAWLAPAEPLDAAGVERCSDNVKTVAHRGREPGLQLQGPSGNIGLKSWGHSILNAIEPIAHWLDQEQDDALYVTALQQQRDKLDDPDNTPSAVLLDGIKKSGSFFEHAQLLSKQHHQYFKDLPQDKKICSILEKKVSESILNQEKLEEESTGSFEDYLAAYLQQIQLKGTASA